MVGNRFAIRFGFALGLLTGLYFTAPACAQINGIARHTSGCEARTSGEGCAETKMRNPNGSTSSRAFWDFCPTKTIVCNFGRSGSRPLSESMPSRSSTDVIPRVPFHPGTMFQVAVRFRGRPAALMKLNVASAVGSSLFREINPEPPPRADVFGPGFSNKKRISAFEPPSNGSKSGNSQSGCALLRFSTNFESAAT